MNKTDFSIFVGLTLNCNMECVYCTERSIDENYIDSFKKNISDENIDNVINFINYCLNDEKFNENFNNIIITFYGGEPLLDEKHLRIIYNKFKNNSRIKFMLFTNGLLLRNIFDILIESQNAGNFGLQISYDGYTLTNKNRISKNGINVSEYLNYLFKDLILNKIKFHTQTTISKKDVSYIYETYLDFLRINNEFPDNYLPMAVSFAIDNNEIDYNINFDLLQQNLNSIIEKEYERIQNNELTILTRRFTSFYNVCASGISQIYIATNGDIYGCHLDEISKINERFVGNINNDFKNILHKFFINRTKNMILANELIKYNSCQKHCLVCLCGICVGKSLISSKKETYIEKYLDIQCDKVFCELYKYLGNALIKLDIVKNNLHKNNT